VRQNERVIGLVLEYRENELGGQKQRKKPQPKQFGARQRRGERFKGDVLGQFENAESGGERHPIPDEIAQPQRHRHERQHDEREKRWIGEAGIANLQHLAAPETRRRLRIGLHAGGKFDKARVIRGCGNDHEQPGAVSPLPR
jgi:hypothetical protein